MRFPASLVRLSWKSGRLIDVARTVSLGTESTQPRREGLDGREMCIFSSTAWTWTGPALRNHGRGFGLSIPIQVVAHVVVLADTKLIVRSGGVTTSIDTFAGMCCLFLFFRLCIYIYIYIAIIHEIHQIFLRVQKRLRPYSKRGFLVSIKSCGCRA